MGAASVSEYVASLNEEQRRHVSAFIDFMSAEYPQLTPKISFSMPMWLLGKKMYEGYVAVSAAKNHFSILFSDDQIAVPGMLEQTIQRARHAIFTKRCNRLQFADDALH